MPRYPEPYYIPSKKQLGCGVLSLRVFAVVMAAWGVIALARWIWRCLV